MGVVDATANGVSMNAAAETAACATTNLICNKFPPMNSPFEPAKLRGQHSTAYLSADRQNHE
jgi:hypothetical protein